MVLQPGDKDWSNRKREPNDCVKGEFRSGNSGRLRDFRNLVIVKTRNNGRDVNADRDTCRMEFGDGVEPVLWS